MSAAEDEERAVFDNEEDGDDDLDGDDSDLDDDDDDEDTEGDDQPPVPPQPSPNPTTPTPAPPIQNPSKPTPEVKIEERRALVPFDDTRRLFQRLWTDDDEIKILNGFLAFTTERGTAFASHQYDTGPFYERIKRELQLDFTKNQLIEKLRRLKKKFRNAAARIAAGKEFVLKSAHDHATFEISRKIWSVGLKRGRDSEDDDLNAAAPNTASVPAFDQNTASATGGARRSRSRRRNRRRIEETAVEVPVAGVAAEDRTRTILALPSSAPTPTLVEETVKSCLGPLFKELLSSVVGAPTGLGLTFGGLAFNSLLPLGSAGSLLNQSMPGTGAASDDKWRKQRILELEVYSKRIELLQDQINSTLEELRSSSTPAGS